MRLATYCLKLPTEGIISGIRLGELVIITCYIIINNFKQIGGQLLAHLVGMWCSIYNWCSLLCRIGHQHHPIGWRLCLSSGGIWTIGRFLTALDCTTHHSTHYSGMCIVCVMRCTICFSSVYHFSPINYKLLLLDNCGFNLRPIRCEALFRRVQPTGTGRETTGCGLLM